MNRAALGTVLLIMIAVARIVDSEAFHLGSTNRTAVLHELHCREVNRKYPDLSPCGMLSDAVANLGNQ